ncbi:DUF2637 domain-containing protein [Kribbella sp. NPDC048915]|uniref:DUF2637 domain-containing protein n=1 Tax=Kribbella sp. NPDC048915 TaxID=3155148 RepID=UPI00340EC5F2
MTTQSTILPSTLSVGLFDRLDQLDELTWPMIAAGAAGLLVAAAVLTGLTLAVRRAGRTLAAAIETGRLTTRRVLIVVAIIAALGVAGVGGARSFGAVSAKFDSPLVPLVADGMIVACTALRLAALTRGWRIPGALVTTYVFIGGTVWLNIDTAHGIADAVAHALAPLAYAVLVEMLAHLLRLYLRLAQPAKPRLSALTWITSPVITTRVWLHLSRTGTDDSAAARALVQQVVRMASRLATLCPSRKLWPFDAARAARTAALQTIRDGLLSAGELAALLPAGGRLTPGELLALVDSAALGLTGPATTDQAAANSAEGRSAERVEPSAAPVWLLAYLLGALRTASQPAPGTAPGAWATAPVGAPVHREDRTAPAAPVHDTAPNGAPAPVHEPHRTGLAARGAAETAPRKTAGPSDAELLDAVVRHAAEHGGAPLGQREIRRATEEAFGKPVGFGRAKRLQELAGWAEPTAAENTDTASPAPQVRGQLQLVNEPNDSDETSTSRELESSNSR